jgi:hypothetical protein
LATGTIFIIFGRAHQLVFPHPANPDQGTQWIPKPSGGTLKLMDQPAQRVCLRYDIYLDQGHVLPEQPASWLVADLQPHDHSHWHGRSTAFRPRNPDFSLRRIAWGSICLGNSPSRPA